MVSRQLLTLNVNNALPFLVLITSRRVRRAGLDKRGPIWVHSRRETPPAFEDAPCMLRQGIRQLLTDSSLPGCPAQCQ